MSSMVGKLRICKVGQDDKRAGVGEMVAFTSLARILGKCSTIQSMPAPFFFEVEISSRTVIPLFMPGSVHSGSAS